MKLISCRIENFGAISGKDFDFSDSITQFFLGNGAGKSTLAAFLKAMFYGLPAAKSNSKFNDRLHYYPFNGGKFGGNVRFSAGGDTYRIERFFGKKSETEDVLKAYINGAPTDKFDKKNAGERSVGEILFGLDAASFERTVFITSDVAEMRSTGGINAKLNNYVYALDGEADAQAAVAALDKAAKNLKMRGGKGAIAEQEEQIKSLKTSVADLQKIAESLDGRYAEYNELSARISSLEDGERERTRREVELGKWARYDDLVAATEAQRAELVSLNAKYPEGLPDREQTAALSAAYRARTELTARLQAERFPLEKQKRSEELNVRFSSGVPDRAELETLGGEVEKLRALRGEAESISSTAEDGKSSALRAEFSGKMPDEGEMEACRASVKSYELARREIMALSEKPSRTGGKTNIFALISALVGVLLSVAGAATCAFYAVAGIPLLIVGGISLAVCAVLFVRGRGAEKQASSSSVKARLDAAEDEIRAFLVPYGVYSSDVVYDFKKFEDDLKEYKALKESGERNEVRLGALRAEAEECQSKLKNRLALYGLDGDDYAAELNALNALVGEYTRLNAEKQAAESSRANLMSRLDGANAQIGGILATYGIADGGEGTIAALERDGALKARLERGIAEGEEKAEKFRSDNRLTERPAPVEEGDFGEVLRQCRARLAILNREISDDEAKTETLADRQNQLENAEERLEEYRQRYRVLTAARDAIKVAENRLNDEFVSPVKKGFTAYARALESAFGDKVSMGKDFALSFESGGELHSDEYLSAGQRAICSLCFRLALIDNMFVGEKPFVIMDDPFVDMDGDSLELAKKLIKELSKDRQFIYFCCHESRTVE